MNKNIIKNKEGSALFLVVLTLSFALVSVMGISDVLIKEIQMGHIQADSTKAYFAAETGIERVLWEDKKNGFNPRSSGGTDNIFTGTLGNNSSYEVDYSTSTDATYYYDKYTAIGAYNNVKRAIEVSLKYLWAP